MRDIKFRCWNAFSNCMHDWDEMVEKNKIHLLNNENKSYVCEQYTGLKDKNGVEIYEGDVVDLGQTVNGCNLFVIEWNGFGFIPRYGVEMVVPRAYEYDVSEFYSICPHTGEGLEVVGNIHQNPELLGS